MKRLLLGFTVSILLIGGRLVPAHGAEEASAIYHDRCAMCHGATGKGDGPTAAVLNPKPKDFQDCSAMSKVADEQLFSAIKDGGQSVGLSPIMPAWGSSITDPQIHALVAYIRNFCKQ